MNNLTKEKHQEIESLIDPKQELEKNGIQKLCCFSQDFLEYTFEVVQKYIETFSINGFRGTTAFDSLSGFVCQIDAIANKELDCKQTIKQDENGETHVNFSEETILRDVIDKTIDKIYNKKLLSVDIEEYPGLRLTQKVCKDMCCCACDEFFEDKQEIILKEKEEKTESKKVEIKQVDKNFAF